MTRRVPLKSDPAKVAARKRRTAAPLARVRKRAGGGGAAFWRSLAVACKDRDRRTCRRCGCTRGMLVAAHIVGLGTGGSRYDQCDTRNRLNNIVTLCERCHVEKDQGWAWSSINVTPDRRLARLYGWRETGGR